MNYSNFFKVSFFYCAIASIAMAQSSINYSVSFDLKRETINVEAILNGVNNENIKFYFPVWAPGAYDIVNYGAKVENFKVQGLNLQNTILSTKLDSNTFTFSSSKNKTLKLSYIVDDFEYDSRSAWFALSDVENKFAFANGTAMFGYVEGKKNIPFTVNYTLPPNWDIVYGLDPQIGTKNGFIAKDYDELVDAPIMCGKFQRIDFNVKNIPHTIAIISPKSLKPTTLKKIQIMTEKVVNAETDFFNDIPYKRYVFQVYLEEFGRGDFGYGALEHSNSSAYRMPYTDEDKLETDLIGVFAHEFFHLWSPKRIHVTELGPFDYQKGPKTKSLWFHEGITEYYARLLPVRYGITTKKNFLDDMERDLLPLIKEKQKRTITELSLKITEANMYQLMGLYTKGPALGFLLDVTIRSQTNNKKSLDDALRFLNEEYGKKGITFKDQDIIPIIEKSTGTKLDDFYSSYIDGLEIPQAKQLLPAIGLKLGGGKIVKEEIGVGFDFIKDGGGYVIKSLVPNSTFEVIGFKVGDTIKSWTKVSNESGKNYASVKKMNGEIVKGEILKIENDTINLIVDELAPKDIIEARKKMLGF